MDHETGAGLGAAQTLDAAGRHAEAVDWLSQAAAAGDVGAATALGKRFLTGDRAPRRKLDGARLLETAMGRGGAEAAAVLAVVTAIGGAAKNWPLALERLALAAERGWAPARAQLAVLSSDPWLAADAETGADDPALWRALAQSVDIQTWTERVKRMVLFEAPRLRAIEGFIPPLWCDWLIERARERLSNTTEPDAAGGEARFDISGIDFVMTILRARAAAVMDMPPLALEPLRIVRQLPGEERGPRFDWLDPEDPAHADEIFENGQRLATFCVWLNDGYGEGDMVFPAVGFRHRGRQGDAAYFANVRGDDDAPEPMAAHADLAPARGEKWLLVQGVRGISPAI